MPSRCASGKCQVRARREMWVPRSLRLQGGAGSCLASGHCHSLYRRRGREGNGVDRNDAANFNRPLCSFELTFVLLLSAKNSSPTHVGSASSLMCMEMCCNLYVPYSICPGCGAMCCTRACPQVQALHAFQTQSNENQKRRNVARLGSYSCFWCVFKGAVFIAFAGLHAWRNPILFLRGVNSLTRASCVNTAASLQRL